MGAVPDLELPDLVTPQQLTDRYQLAKNLVEYWLNTGELVGFKLGRRWYVHIDDWRAFIDRRRDDGEAFVADAEDD